MSTPLFTDDQLKDLRDVAGLPTEVYEQQEEILAQLTDNFPRLLDEVERLRAELARARAEEREACAKAVEEPMNWCAQISRDALKAAAMRIRERTP